MYLKFINAAAAYKGSELALRADLIITVARHDRVREDGVAETVTFLNCGETGTWEVEDSLDSVVERLNGSKQKFGLQWLKNYRAKI